MYVSIITTVRDGDAFIDQFMCAHQRLNVPSGVFLEVVIVDDNKIPSQILQDSLARLLQVGYRTQYIHSGGSGRSSSLNMAINAATSRYCLVQDFDDIPLRNRIQVFIDDLREKRLGVVTLYSGLYAYSRDGKVDRLQKIAGVKNINRAIRKSMPLPHTFMAIDKEGLGAIRYSDLIAGIDYRFVCDVYMAGLPVVLLNRRVGIHFKYAQSNFAKRSKIKSQLSFISSQWMLFAQSPSIVGAVYLLGRIIRLPLFFLIDQKKRR